LVRFWLQSMWWQDHGDGLHSEFLRLNVDAWSLELVPHDVLSTPVSQSFSIQELFVVIMGVFFVSNNLHGKYRSIMFSACLIRINVSRGVAPFPLLLLCD
jgi:hypothetical protein